MVFSESTRYELAQFLPAGGGYGTFLHGNVVDMLYFPIIRSTYPSWFPFIGGENFEFFSPIFNIADASISVGVITLLIFQNRFFHKEEHHTDKHDHEAVETTTELGDKAHVV